MPRYSVNNFFTMKSVSPRGLQQDNLIQFSYHSPNGVHDKQPLVFVLEKQLDRFYGLNFHYDSTQLVDLIDTTSDKINEFLEEEWSKKYPDKLQKLNESRKPFSKKLLTEKDLKEFGRRLPKKDLEQYFYEPKATDIFRTYLYKRMNSVSKLVWKL